MNHLHIVSTTYSTPFLLKIFDFTCTGGFSFVPLRVFAKQNGICQRLKYMSSSEKQQYHKDLLRGLELADYRMLRNKAMHHLMV